MIPPTDDRQHSQQALEHAATQVVGALSPFESDGWFREHLASDCEVCRDAVRQITALCDQLLLAAPPAVPPAKLRGQLLAAVRTAPNETGSVETGPVETGPVETGPVETGPVETGPVETGPVETGPAKTPSEKAGSDDTAGDGDRADTPTADEIQVWNQWAGSETSKFATVVSAVDSGWQTTGVDGVSVRPLHIDEQKDLVTMLIRMDAGTAWPRHRHAEDEQCFVLAGDLLVEDEHLHAGDFQYAPADSIHGIQRTEGGCTLLVVSSRHDELLTG